MKNILFVILMICSSFSHANEFDCFENILSKYDTKIKQLENNPTNDKDSIEFYKLLYHFTTDAFTAQCEIIKKDWVIKGNKVIKDEINVEYGWRKYLEIDSQGNHKALNISVWYITALTSLSANTISLGKFTDKDLAISRARSAWKTGKYYSISIGNYCRPLFKDDPRSINLCDDIIWKAKN